MEEFSDGGGKPVGDGGGGVWEEYTNIDMCGQGDVEIIGNWTASHSIDDLKRMVETKGYSAFTVSPGQQSFGHAGWRRSARGCGCRRRRRPSTCSPSGWGTGRW